MNIPEDRAAVIPTIVQFNLNQYVYVRLTPAGRAWDAAKHAMMNARAGIAIPYQEHHENAQGYSRWTAWEFMNTFGDQMYQGNKDQVCEMSILLDLKAP